MEEFIEIKEWYEEQEVVPELLISVYIEVDKYNNIIRVFSSDFEEPTLTSIKIDEGIGDKYRHAQSQYFEKPLINEDGTYNYSYKNNKVVIN